MNHIADFLQLTPEKSSVRGWIRRISIWILCDLSHHSKLRWEKVLQYYTSRQKLVVKMP